MILLPFRCDCGDGRCFRRRRWCSTSSSKSNNNNPSKNNRRSIITTTTTIINMVVVMLLGTTLTRSKTTISSSSSWTRRRMSSSSTMMGGGASSFVAFQQPSTTTTSRRTTTRRTTPQQQTTTIKSFIGGANNGVLQQQQQQQPRGRLSSSTTTTQRGCVYCQYDYDDFFMFGSSTRKKIWSLSDSMAAGRRKKTTGSSGATSSLYATVATTYQEEASSASASVQDDKDTDDDDEEVVQRLPTNDDDEELLKIRHSSAHVMAMAVQQLYPNGEAQVTIGPWIDNGFYYDFYFPPTINTTTGEMINEGRKLSDQDLKQIKKHMDKIISKDYPILYEEVTRDEAKKRIEAINEPFKLEILDSIQTEPITIYSIGNEWWDLCAGPHVTSTGQLPKKAIQLLSVNGAYWRGNENREMLQRIYATAWKTPQQLKQYKKQLEEAKKRDHRMLGKKLDLFSIQQDTAGGGLVFWHPKGSIVRTIIENFWKHEHQKAGYDLVFSPHIANIDLWKISGHFDFYKDDMFDQMNVDDEQYQIKTMNCPFHCLMYKNTLRSYRDLPIRWAELGTVYRYERTGTLHGLFRVRGFTQDDAHIFCLPTQLQQEIVNVLDLTERILTKFGFTQYDIMLSTRPEKSVGTDDIWIAATDALKGALEIKGWNYSVDDGGGAFYGPKIDIKIRDAIGRSWQCSTIQCDFNLPDRFDLEYVSAENSGERKRPIMVHRAIFGSIERFFGILIENSAGDFPLWLAPIQLRLLPVTDTVLEYCNGIIQQSNNNSGGNDDVGNSNIRLEIDNSNERLAKQIRNAEQQRIPLMGIIGIKEMETNTITIRSRKLGDLGTFHRNELLDELKRCTNNAIEMTKTKVKVDEEVMDEEQESK